MFMLPTKLFHQQRYDQYAHYCQYGKYNETVGITNPAFQAGNGSHNGRYGKSAKGT